SLLDDYFIYPPTAADLADLRKLSAPAPAPQPPRGQWRRDLPPKSAKELSRAPANASLCEPRDFAALVSAATSATCARPDTTR
ncbi:MAG TPA: hypothetical protein PLU22_20720, partial [Polyangiaceae bacterium]|nr:hypothetical protein [Polyangiaceae bacterium]